MVGASPCYDPSTMADITKTFDPVTDLTVFDVVGEATFDEVWDVSSAFFRDGRSRLVLWDMTHGTVTPLTNEELEAIVKRAASFGVIEDGKIAIAAPRDVDYGLSRAYQIYGDMHGYPMQTGVFRSRTEGMNWLVSEDGTT